MCAETIQLSAKVCPHCQHWQKKLSFQNPQIGMTLWVVFIAAAMVCLGLVMDRLFGPRTPFAEHRDALSVVSSEFSHRVAGSNLYITVVGILTNRGNIAWKNIGVEAQFVDKSGKVIDAITVDADYYRGVTALPHGTAATITAIFWR